MSALYQKQTYAVQQTTPLFDHLSLTFPAAIRALDLQTMDVAPLGFHNDPREQDE